MSSKSTPPALVNIERLTRDYADSHAALAARVSALNAALEEVKRAHLNGIKLAVKSAASAKATLSAEIASNAQLFQKPRTVVFHGIKIGMRKGEGVLEYDDAEAVVARIKKVLPEMKDALIATKETPNKAAIQELPAADLKRLGCTITDTTDAVVIKHTDSEVEKLVTALLKEHTERLLE